MGEGNRGVRVEEDGLHLLGRQPAAVWRGRAGPLTPATDSLVVIPQTSAVRNSTAIAARRKPLCVALLAGGCTSVDRRCC